MSILTVIRPAATLALAVIVIIGSAGSSFAQKKMDRLERESMKLMLKNLKNEIKRDYYDETYRGINLDERFKKAEARLEEVETTGQSLAVIAQVLMDFDDSHLYFSPPSTNLSVEYGWRHQIHGDKLIVYIVKPKSDAEAKGLKVGDQIVSIEGFKPTRKEMWKVFYYYNILSKRPSLKLQVLSPGSDQPRAIEIQSELTRLPRVYTRTSIAQLFDTTGRSGMDYNYTTTIGSAVVWKMPSFMIEPSSIDTLMGRVKGSQALILDLRGNGGGAVKTMERLASFMFDKDIKIADLKGRKKMDPMESKKRSDAYTGKLVVLIDADSGSASEIFARLVQLEKRGMVVGDTSAGAVLQAQSYEGSLGGDGEVAYGASVTNADVIMSDGKSLEHVGVTPDHIVIPTPADIAANRDPVLAKAAELVGASLTPEQAGSIFKLKWVTGQNGLNRIEIAAK
jgi:C-terminal processing protease CtpA/Prc